ncbi:uncharacterized protein LOC132199797 [Neocloeon triangulifer]|uniref:uncharacterized protein LOC132199797 n=1 Tax=Neocloeon triangulifer TaxID=2078957 RepID=UPI00286EDEE6|nr:uncharacterized protein LOC132199797 [Neocloeon triangulifer]XP_059480779.1 uncharacterized protein LOC132199797 [Neocloeon triangulifer]XP_059480780.1 uncharacterized protein LOC132199797 [Neocloeon triangulifer]
MVRKSPRKASAKKESTAEQNAKDKRLMQKKADVIKSMLKRPKLKLDPEEAPAPSSSSRRKSKLEVKKEVAGGDVPPYVPPHMLGRDLTDPLADQTEGSNRSLQKPRYGVKVPNRNLTSPILTHTELNRELLARSHLRRPIVGSDVTQLYGAAGSYLFSLRMVSRLSSSMTNRTYPLKLNPHTLKLTLNTNLQLRPKLDAETERALALKQLQEMKRTF